MSVFCSLPANAKRVLERGERCRADMSARSDMGVELLAGRGLFEQLCPNVRVTYRFVPPAPPTVHGKHAKRKWGSANARWVHATVQSRSDTHVWLRDRHGGKCVELSVSDVSNRVVLEWS